MSFAQFLDTEIKPGMSKGRLSPPGQQIATIVKVEDKEISSGTGRQVKLTLEANGYSESILTWCIYQHTVDDWKWKKGQAKLRLIVESVGLTWPLTDIQLLAGRPIGIDKINEPSMDSFDDNGDPWVNTTILEFMPVDKITRQPIMPQADQPEVNQPLQGTGEDAPEW